MNDCFIDHGGKTITGSGVEQIIVKNGKVTGVAMEDGNEYYSDVVVSNMTFPRTFLECMDAKDLKPEFLRKVKNFKIRGLLRKSEHRPGRLAGFRRTARQP